MWFRGLGMKKRNNKNDSYLKKHGNKHKLGFICDGDRETVDGYNSIYR